MMLLGAMFVALLSPPLLLNLLPRPCVPTHTAGSQAVELHTFVSEAVGQQHQATRAAVLDLGEAVKQGHGGVKDFGDLHCGQLAGLQQEVAGRVKDSYMHEAPPSKCTMRRPVRRRVVQCAREGRGVGGRVCSWARSMAAWCSCPSCGWTTRAPP